MTRSQSGAKGIAAALLCFTALAGGCPSEIEDGEVEGGSPEAPRGEGGGEEGGGGEDAGDAPASPTGEVSICLGDACPYEECDNELFFSDLPCSTVYPEPLSESAELCPGGMSGGYCLAAGDEQWAINCDAAVANLEFCPIGGCSAAVDAGCARPLDD